jgi:hypothetical protein
VFPTIPALTLTLTSLPTEYYVKRAHPQCADDVAIRKITFPEDDRLEMDVRSASSGIDALIVLKYLRILG